MEKKFLKQLFSACIVIAMVLSMCPTIVFAENTIPANADFGEYTYVAFGDSIVYGADGDTGSRMEKPYVTLVGETLGIGNVINLAKSGSTWTECPPRTNMAQRAIKYNGKADIISVGLGTNDYAAKKTLGDMNSRDNTTIYGSIHMVAESLTTKYPNAFIFFTTPIKYKTENNGVYNLSDVAKAVKDVAAEYDIPVLDLYNEFDWDPLTEVKDQIHPNQVHHTEQLAPLVTEFIREHMETVSKDACPCDTCKGADATWTTWDGTTALENGKHYRLADNVQLTGMITVAAGTTVVLDLNGKTITAAADSRCFEVSGELSIINSTDDVDADGNYTGLITGGVAATNDTDNVLRGGNINIEKGTSASNPGGTLKLYGGTIANGKAANAGGNVKVGKFAKFYMYGGTIADGKAETSTTAGNGGNMNVDNGAKFYMYGGIITGGNASASGGNIYVWKGTIDLYDGVITGGKSGADSSSRGGGNIWLNAANATLNMYGGEISNGEAKRYGGNIYLDNATGKINMEGGLITGGKTTQHGGNIYAAAGTVKVTGGVISNGKANWDTATSAHTTATNDGGNIYLSGAKAYLGGDATITGGSVGTGSNQYGGNIYATTAGAELYLYDQAQILGGSAYEGKNIYAMTNPKVYMYGGTVKNGNFKVGTSGSFHMYGGQVEDMAWSGSGTQETVIYNGILGSNSSGLPEKLEACKAACATVTQTTHVEGHTVYAVYQTSLTDGACATCGHTYTAANCGTCATYSHPAVKVANCEFCNADVVWAPLLGNELVADHYYLAEDVALTDKIGLTVDDAVCIDLNGHNLTTADVTTGITLTSAMLNITNTSADDSAIISGGGGILAANKASGELRPVINFKNVTVSGGHAAENGGNISVNSVDLVIDNCVIRDGYASKNGGNVSCYATNLTIKGNTQIIKGFACNNGDDLYLGTTSKAQMYSGTVGDICQLNSTGSFHLYGGTIDELVAYNYSTYNSSFYMYGGTVNSIGVQGEDKEKANGVIALYAGTVGNDPRIANNKKTTMVAECSCVTKNADGTYTVMHTGGTSTCDICSASDVYEGGYTYPAAFAGEHTPAEAVKENVVAPSVSTDGSYDLVTYCSVCGAELSRVPTVDPATGVAIVQSGDTSTTYGTLKEALEAAQDGNIVDLLADADADGTKIANKVILDLNGHTVTGTIELVENASGNAGQLQVSKRLDSFTVVENLPERHLKFVLDAGGLDYPYEGTFYAFLHELCPIPGGMLQCDGCGETRVCEHPSTTTIDKKDATCLEPGYTGDSKCDVCTMIVQTGSAINQLEHSYIGANGVCINGCGNIYCDNNGHDWKEDGTCNNGCGRKQCDYGHTMGEPTREDIVEATCMDDGHCYLVYRCTVCGEVLDSQYNILDKKGHQYDPDTQICVNGCDQHRCVSEGHTEGETKRENEVPATCAKPGSYDLVTFCAVCGTELSRVPTEVPATGEHKYDVTYTDPTTEKDGFWTHTCACGDSYTVTDPNTRLHVSMPTVGAGDIVTEGAQTTPEDIEDVIKHVIHNEMVIDKDVFVDEANNAVIEQMKQDDPTLADKEPVLHITLKGMGIKSEAGELVAHKLVFDVTPMLGDKKIENLQAPLTFHLPIDDSLTGNAYVFHEGEFMGVYEIITEGGHNYVVVSSLTFSQFTVAVGNVTDVALNTTTGVGYASVQEALNAASNGATVKLLKDATEEYIFVGAGLKLDLNGKKLTVEDTLTAAFATSHIVDTTNGEGLLVLTDASSALNGYNEQLPMWTAEGVRFTAASFREDLEIKDENTAQYAFYLNMDLLNSKLGEILANGTAGTGITIRIKVTYTTANGMTAVQYFELTSDMVAEYVENSATQAIALTVTGIQGRENLTFTAEITSQNPNDPKTPIVVIDKVDN